MNQNPLAIFFVGILILALFIWYFAADKDVRKRAVGSALAIILTAFCLFAIYPPDEKIKLGIDLQGGSSFVVQLQKEEGSEKVIDAAAQQQAIAVIEKRLNPDGSKDLLIAPQGEDRILVQMPGISEEEVNKVVAILEQVAKLEFSIIHPQSATLAERVAKGEDVAPGWLARQDFGSVDRDDTEAEPEWVLIKVRPDMTGNVKRAFPQLGPQGWIINLEFNAEGAKQFDEIASNNQNQRLAIIMDGEVLSSPRLLAKFYGGNAQITGQFTADEARELSSALENPLENPLEIINSYRVSPTMGAETIRQGISAGLAGLAVTLVFMVLYYRFAGGVAIIGLSFNIILLFGALALFEFTLTLPGIAGIILTIGIAIDANVLIYERLREELRAGRSLTSAIDAAYDKAFSAIFDANFTTLITAVILFVVASGTVKGFAITLTIGILASLFSALVITRICFGLSTSSGLFKKLNLWDLIPQKEFDFLGKRRFTLMASSALVVAMLAVVGIKGGNVLGVDFRGGDLLTLHAAKDVDEAAIQDAVSDLGLAQQPYVQTLKAAAGGGEFITVRSAENTGDIILTELRKDLGQEFPDATQEHVGAVIGREMAESSAMALAVGLIGIFLYVSFRFEFSFAVGAIVALFHDLIITFGIVVLSGREISLILVGAFLTIAGYSINDTIVVFDRIREGLLSKRGDVADVMNDCISATLSRTLLTSFTTLLTLIILYFFAGPALNSFAFTNVVGILVGTYSSIFVASPIVLWWARARKTNLRREILDAEQAAVKPAGTP